MNDRAALLASVTERFQSFLRGTALIVFLAALIWAPFPLGGAIAWAYGVQALLIALSAAFWLTGALGSDEYLVRGNRSIFLPFVLMLGTLAWAVVQILPGMPQAWIHPVWQMAAGALHLSLAGTISLNPWRGEAEIVKLSSYALAAFLAFRMSRDARWAAILLNAVIAIGALYAVYAFALDLLGYQQANLFYAVPYQSQWLSGPFMSHNSFATFEAMAAIAAVVRLFSVLSEKATPGQSLVKRLISALQFCTGRGAPLTFAFLLTFGAVAASASRGGLAATAIGFVAIAMASLPFARTRAARLASISVFIFTFLVMGALVFFGDSLAARLAEPFIFDGGDNLRLSMWDAALRMIQDAPMLGMGLGSFEDAYPMYAVRLFPVVIDKAHCDYLEFTAGLGIPAACAWFLALLLILLTCLRALFIRRRNRSYALAALGAMSVVAVHSTVDFSLQMPAVSLFFATLIGIGLGQSQSTRSRY
ncbi:O-antigen ligase [Rhizomicrobium palustre]|uniref:O-antigen ligase n=1 Tax=Rhizomicrobium palustre TaxID=189966 RepID=A0A846MYM9_9PROT|nr:O-antigen ligase family protein [Rhizomicrobium palustre]NIK88349.1 O-antigen ligase [Rhizomicrobium palustre]